MDDSARSARARLRSGVASQLGVRWRPVWAAIKPIPAAAAGDEPRVAGVNTLGLMSACASVCPPGRLRTVWRGPKNVAGIVDRSTNESGAGPGTLLDLVPSNKGPLRRPPPGAAGQHRSPRLDLWAPSRRRATN